MYRLDAYHRPASVAETLDLVAAPNRLILAGGTTLRHDGGGRPTEVVDLQALGLDRIELGAEVVRIDAMVTLEGLVRNETVPELLRTAAKAELPSTLRTVATVGGTIGAAQGDSLLLTALLVHDTSVHFADGRFAPLSAVLGSGVAADELIVAVEAYRSGTTALARTGRTPADDPIVAAAGRVTDEGIRLALSGVAATPELVDPNAIDRLQPPGDFRGTSEYRHHLARVLSTRVMEQLS